MEKGINVADKLINAHETHNNTGLFNPVSPEQKTINEGILRRNNDRQKVPQGLVKDRVDK